MTLLSTDTYEDAQYQSDAPIGKQEPIPTGVHSIELSWDRSRGYMRIMIGDQKWWFKEYLGKAVVVGTDNGRGRITLRCPAHRTPQRTGWCKGWSAGAPTTGSDTGAVPRTGGCGMSGYPGMTPMR